jgi:very-short-patch-repair endonuclease
MKNYRGEITVAIINNHLDFNILTDHLWYRIPVSSAEKWLKNRWPPQWLAFYQTKLFGAEQHAVNYYGQVVDIQRKYRWELFPNQPNDERSRKQYYQIFLKSLERLPRPIISQRRRRLVFIPTTWQKFMQAKEINDLYDDSPLEDMLWEAFKKHDIPAERQELVTVKGQNFMLDFAIYCANGKINVEANGDKYHLDKEHVYRDKQRSNALTSAGWEVLRFTTPKIRKELNSYCLPTLTKTVNRLNGIDDGGLIPRKINLDLSAPRQLGLFNEG